MVQFPCTLLLSVRPVYLQAENQKTCEEVHCNASVSAVFVIFFGVFLSGLQPFTTLPQSCMNWQ